MEGVDHFFAPQDDFRKEGDDNSNMVVMHRTYHFLHSLSDSMLAFIMTRCGRSTQVVLLRQDGGVFQRGAIQTVVRKRIKGNGEMTRSCTLYISHSCTNYSLVQEKFQFIWKCTLLWLFILHAYERKNAPKLCFSVEMSFVKFCCITPISKASCNIYLYPQ